MLPVAMLLLSLQAQAATGSGCSVPSLSAVVDGQPDRRSPEPAGVEPSLRKRAIRHAMVALSVWGGVNLVTSMIVAGLCGSGCAGCMLSGGFSGCFGGGAPGAILPAAAQGAAWAGMLAGGVGLLLLPLFLVVEPAVGVIALAYLEQLDTSFSGFALPLFPLCGSTAGTILLAVVAITGSSFVGCCGGSIAMTGSGPGTVTLTRVLLNTAAISLLLGATVFIVGSAEVALPGLVHLVSLQTLVGPDLPTAETAPAPVGPAEDL